MTSLELIEEEIKRLKDILESDYVRDVPYLRDTKYTTWANDRLQTLEQIKLELEAWEKVEKLIGVVEVPKLNPFMGNVWTENYLSFITNPYITKETAVIIKKALEIDK